MKFRQIFAISASLTLIVGLIQPPAPAQANRNAPIIAQIAPPSEDLTNHPTNYLDYLAGSGLSAVAYY